jgi:hypothetical protein
LATFPFASADGLVVVAISALRLAISTSCSAIWPDAGVHLGDDVVQHVPGAT